MCCHSRIIYATCGHSSFCPRPLIECRDASFNPSVPWSTGCEIVAHPYKSLRLNQLCPACTRTRERLLNEIDEAQAVKFDEWQWKVSYGMPSGGNDFWSKKAEEREEREEREGGGGEERRKAEISTPSTPKTPLTARRKHSSIKRFSWRKGQRKSGKMADITE